MTQQTLFYRKITYLVLIAILLFPLYRLGSPSQRQQDGATSSGGKLAEMRSESGLSEANLGKIDPAGSAVKLATFGMRGVAISLLWNRSQEYEKRADWDNVIATANQIITLEPHFITIWDYVGWSLAYNASAMFDDYRERYRWVIRGFEFVQRGTVYNRTAPKLYVRAGWNISQKVGIADEKKQYRRLFREDDEFAARQAEQEIFVSYRDNWLLGHAFYKRAEDLYENHNGDIGKETRLLFFGRAPLNRIRFAEWISIDGCGVNKTNTPVFDEENCAKAWKLAQEDWELYSNKVVTTTIQDKANPDKYRETSLALQREAAKELKDYEDQLVSFLPEGETRETVIWDRWNNELDDKQRASMYELIIDPIDENDYHLGKDSFPSRVVRAYLDGQYGEQPEWDNWRQKLYDLRMTFIDEDLRAIAERPEILMTEDERKDRSAAFELLNEWRPRAAQLLRTTPEVLASLAVPEKAAEARDIVAEMQKISAEESFSRMFRDIMGADYHEAQVAFEQTAEARKAREHRQAVRDCYYDGQPEEADKEFLASFDSWVALLDRDDFSYLKYLPQMQSELMDEAEKYLIVLEQLEKAFPAEFSFQDVIRRDERVEARLKEAAKAEAYIAKTIEEGDFKKARDDAELLLTGWSHFNADFKIFELGPLPEGIDSIFNTTKLWVQAWEGMSANEFELAKQSGVFSNYPSRNFVEFMIQKRDDNYQQIEKLEIERMNDVEKNLEFLEQEVSLWAKVVETAPVLKYDTTSELTGQLLNVVQEYQAELQKNGESLPEDFPLNDFLPLISGT
ncbi:MAG: hypothetical protein ACOX0A_04920 [Thermoguttaceae bacterium]|jgi:hypothetical protein